MRYIPDDQTRSAVSQLRYWYNDAEPVAAQRMPSIGQWRSAIRLMHQFKELRVDSVVLTEDPVLGRNVTTVLQRFGQIIHSIPMRKRQRLINQEANTRRHQ